MTSENKLIYCSFCNTHKDKVKKLIVSEDVAICSDCIELCNNLVEDNNLVGETQSKEEEIKYDPSDIKEY